MYYKCTCVCSLGAYILKLIRRCTGRGVETYLRSVLYNHEEKYAQFTNTHHMNAIDVELQHQIICIDKINVHVLIYM